MPEKVRVEDKLSHTRPGQEQARTDIIGQVRLDQVRSAAELGRVTLCQAKSGASQEGQLRSAPKSGHLRQVQIMSAKGGHRRTATQSQQLAPHTNDYSVDFCFCRCTSGAGLQSSS